jgi:uncharacterized membrane protein
MLDFIVLAYLFGPGAAVPYGIYDLGLDPLTVFTYLTIMYLAPMPLFFWLFESEAYYRRLYRGSILQKFSRITKKQIKDLTALGDEIQEKFEERLGHLGFYLAISVFTFLFGVFWAALFAYLLKVERRKAVLSISAGVLVCNSFWLLISYVWPLKTPLELAAFVLLFSLLIYGRDREIRVMKKVASRIKALRD